MEKDLVLQQLFWIGAAAAFLSALFSLLSRWIAVRLGAVDAPGGRKKHTKTTPLLGGLGILAAILVVSLFAWPNMVVGTLRHEQVIGILAAFIILTLGGVLDDVHPLPPAAQILFPVLASILVIATGTGIIQVTNLFQHGAVRLDWWHLGPVSIPSDILTFVWLIIATYATKVQDGVDGLVSGLAVIGAALVAALSLSTAYFQPEVATFATVVGAAFFGFLFFNAYPAKQFLGEAGSTIAGFGLGVLAILSGAKIAIALCVLAIPIADIVLVVLGRLVRGVPWHQGDRSHLHFRLIAAGLSPRAVVFLMWSLCAAAGVLALGLQTRGKIFLVGALICFTAMASFASGLLARKKGRDDV